MCVLVAPLFPVLCDPMVSRQAPLSMGFPRQEYWNGLPFPSPGDLLDPGIKHSLLHCGQILYSLGHLYDIVITPRCNVPKRILQNFWVILLCSQGWDLNYLLGQMGGAWDGQKHWARRLQLGAASTLYPSVDHKSLFTFCMCPRLCEKEALPCSKKHIWQPNVRQLGERPSRKQTNPSKGEGKPGLDGECNEFVKKFNQVFP